jgi:hypothetical protein
MVGADNNTMSGRSEQVNTTLGVSSTYACYNCCPDSVIQARLNPLSLGFEVGEQNQFGFEATVRNCYLSRTFFQFEGFDWSSSNLAVGEISNSGWATAIDSGYALMTGYFEEVVWESNTYYCESQSNTVSDTGAMEVEPDVQKIQYKVNNTWVDVPSGGLGPICKGTSVTFKAIPASGSWSSNYPIWGGDAGGTGAEKTVTFSNSGSRTITARSNNTVSATIDVGPDNGNISITWLAPDITTTNSSGSATTTAAPFVPEYIACGDLSANEWKLRVKKVEGKTNITIPTGGYRNPSTHPPTSQTDATDAVDEMNDYYPSGMRQSWHTPGASEAHEKYHDSEWRCTGNHY